MDDNFFLDGLYTQNQINSINKIKSKTQSVDSSTDIAGNSNSIFDDINSYKSDKTKKTDNSNLFDYIDKIIGMDNFLNILDADGDGNISKKEAEKLSTLDSNSALNSADINKLYNDVKTVNSAKSSVKNSSNNTTTECTYKANESDTNKKLVKDSSVVKNASNQKIATYTYNSDNTINTKEDLVNNTTTTYTYETNSAGKPVKKTAAVKDNKTNEVTTYTYKTDSNGKLVKDSAVKTDALGKVIARYTYNSDNTVNTKEDLVNNTKTTYTYKTDNNGKSIKEAVTVDGNKNRTTTIISEKDPKTGKYVKKTGSVKHTTSNTELEVYTYENGRVKTKENKLDNSITTYEYEENTGVKTSAITKRGDKTLAEYTYKNGKVATKLDKIENTTTTYEYNKEGIRTSHTVTINDGKNTLKSKANYDSDGRYVINETKYYSSTTGLKDTYHYEYTRDSQGRISTAKRYKGEDATGTLVGDYEYTYPKDTEKYNNKPTSRKNKLNNVEKFYTYDENNVLTDAVFKKDGKELYSYKCNEDGTYASKTEGDTIFIYDYTNGIKTKATKYKTNQIGADGKPKANEKALLTITYDDGVKAKSIDENDDETEYDENGNKTKTTSKDGKKITFWENNKEHIVIDGDYAKVYTYENGTKKETTYKAEDIDKVKGKVKDGAKPVTTDTTDKSNTTGSASGTGTQNDGSVQASSASTKTESSTPTDKDWGVFIGKTFHENSDLSRLTGRDNVVIDAQDHKSATIKKIKDSGTEVFSYLNIGSIENYRDYYKAYKKYALKTYENWNDEKWMDVSHKEWQDFVVNNLAEQMIKKGCDGVWLDNTDVYEEYHNNKTYQGLLNIVTRLKEKGLKIYINGGNEFVSRLISEGKANLVDGVMQEEVYSEITSYSGKGKFKTQSKGTRHEHEAYLKRCRSAGITPMVLEYTRDEKLKKEIKEECKKNGFKYYISGDVMLT